VVWVEFDWGTNIYTARQIVSEKIALVSNDLPPEVERPILAPISSIMGEVMFAAVTSEKHSTIELRTVADTVIRRRLLAVPGVAQVTPTGGDVKQYQVHLSSQKLAAYGVTVSEVLEALEMSNENVSAGFMVQLGSEYLVTGVGRVQKLQDIADTVISATGGVPVRVGDLARIEIGGAPKRGEGSANSRPAVILGIQKQPNANTLTLTEELDRVLDDLQGELPQGMVIEKNLFRQADFIEVAVRNVEDALRDGAILVVIIMFVFLMNVRATFITLTAIPLSLLGAVLVMKAMGETINTMTLGGMAIAVGALVDDAVILVENVVRRLRENSLLPQERRASAISVLYGAGVEIQSSIVFATFIIALVFLPIFFLSGVEGRLMQPLATAYIVALFSSLFVALTVTPVLCYLLLPGSTAIQKGHEPRFARFLKRVYNGILTPVLDHPLWVMTPILLVFVIAVVGFLRSGRSFLPEFNEGSLTIAAVTLPGTSLAESDALGRLVEDTVLSHPEVIAVARRTGRAELDEHAQGVEASEMEVSLEMKDRSKAEFLAALRNDLTHVPGTNITIGQPISHRIDHMLSGTKANLAIKIFGSDLYKLRDLAEKVRLEMSVIPGVVDLSIEQQMDIPVVKVKFDRNALARHGLRIADVAHVLEASLQGVPVTQIYEGRNTFDLVVRVDPGDAGTPQSIGRLLILTPSGAHVPLETVARIIRTTGPNTIGREQVERKIVVMCNVAGRDIGSVVQDCREAIDPIIDAEPSYSVQYGGQFESAEAATRTLAITGVLVILGIGFLLNIAFGSVRDALFVMTNLPLALIGGVVGVYVSGGVLSVASLIGFISVFGIAARNGIILISHVRHLQLEEGVTDFREAVSRGARERLIPILMTAMATGLALIPLALGGDKPGNEIQTPMAIVIIFGLLTSMLLNMIVVPTLYLRFGRPLQPVDPGEMI
jgi:CzcA family heavy metal efflux pump